MKCVMNESSLLIPPELKTWPHTRISRKSLFLDLLINMFLRYDEANICFGRVYYNSVLLWTVRKEGLCSITDAIILYLMG
jgi:hypothetical protein